RLRRPHQRLRKRGRRPRRADGRRIPRPRRHGRRRRRGLGPGPRGDRAAAGRRRRDTGRDDDAAAEESADRPRPLTMYTPRHFAETDLAGLDALAARDPFVTLVTVADGVPAVSHLPVLYARDGERIVLRGHWSRANPQWRHGDGPALAIVHGPHAY